MPFGPEPLGLAYFADVKLAGYSIAGGYLRNRLSVTRPRALTFGVARTLLGIAAGVAFVAGAAMCDVFRSEIWFYVLLFPVRLLEWLVAVWFFFGRSAPLPGTTYAKSAVLGSVWSYVLDIPAVIALFTLPGGAWIC